MNSMLAMALGRGSSDASVGSSLRDSRGKEVVAAAEPVREELVQSAVGFLKHPKVVASSDVQRRSFLEKKGLTVDEIDEAFRRLLVRFVLFAALSAILFSEQGWITGSSDLINLSNLVSAIFRAHLQTLWVRILAHIKVCCVTCQDCCLGGAVVLCDWSLQMNFPSLGLYAQRCFKVQMASSSHA